MFRVAVCLGIVCVMAGCAARGARPGIQSAPSSLQTQKAEPTGGLEEFMSKVRERSWMARPVASTHTTIEASDAVLAAAVQAVKMRPTAATHRAAAAQYLRQGITDVAHEHFTAAVKLDSRDAASWDGLARIWRDWGFPNLALPDATRAVYYAPDSPVVHNTLGTILQVLGRRTEARAQYEKALAVDATAAYALTNLCYGWALEGRADKAANACRQALRLRPDMEAARNNLAVAYEVSGDSNAALDVLTESGNAARTQYNAGILHLAARRYPEALKAFDKALALRPPFAAAELMARQTRRQLQEGTAR
jgi:tetratricopeptide (TPR) repeat protein